MTTAILDLETLITRPVITIDGERYEIAASDELSLADSQRVAMLGRWLDKMMKADSAGFGDESVMKKLLGDIAAIVMAPVPEPVRAKLKDGQLLAVLEVFTMLSLSRKTRLAGATMKAMGPDAISSAASQVMTAAAATIGASPLPGSSGSTAATPSAG